MTDASRPAPSDHFSSRASDYARYRPYYPAPLFDWLASLAPGHHLAWDCAAGTGQASVPLAAYFERVIGTDLSAAQIALATPHERVEYRVATAEASGLPSRSVDLVNVSQALHWLDLDAFYAEVRRVLVPHGVISASSYDSATLDSRALATIFERYEHETLGAYWPARRALVGKGLLTLDFPFDELALRTYTLETQWTLEQVVGYARSWSATAHFVERHGEDPTPRLAEALRRAWGPPGTRRVVRWPFVVRVGRIAP